MSIEAIQNEIATWDVAMLKKMMGYIAALRQRKEDPDFPNRMTALIDDKTPGRWLTQEEAEKRLGISPASEE
jgi:hypothetical protein